MADHAHIARMVKYRPLGYVAKGGDMAAVITMVRGDGTVDLTVFPPGNKTLQTLTRIKYNAKACEADAKEGTCYP